MISCSRDYTCTCLYTHRIHQCTYARVIRRFFPCHPRARARLISIARAESARLYIYTVGECIKRAAKKKRAALLTGPAAKAQKTSSLFTASSFSGVVFIACMRQKDQQQQQQQ